MTNGLAVFITAIGGGIGALLRYILGLIIMNRFPHPPIPVAMLIVNLSGSLGLGLLYGALIEHSERLYSSPLFVAIGIGFFGAFTTFSTFSVEAVELIKKRLYKKTFIYVAASILGSILGFASGYFFMKF